MTKNIKICLTMVVTLAVGIVIGYLWHRPSWQDQVGYHQDQMIRHASRLAELMKRIPSKEEAEPWDERFERVK